MEKNSKQGKPNNMVANFKAQERKRNLIFAAVLLVVTLIIGGAVYGTQVNKAEKTQNLVAPKGVTDDYGVLYTPEDAGSKSLDKPVKITLVEDFSCPACKTFEESAGATLDNLVAQGRVALEYHMVGFLDDGPAVNNHSKRAGSAAYCVRDSDGMAGWRKYHDWLYENQPNEGSEGQSNQEFIDGAKKLGLNPDETCVKSEKYVPYMVEATTWFNENFSGTPTVLVDGEEVASDPLSIVKAVDAASGKTTGGE